jgi:hypothetical protein
MIFNKNNIILMLIPDKVNYNDKTFTSNSVLREVNIVGEINTAII